MAPADENAPLLAVAPTQGVSPAVFSVGEASKSSPPELARVLRTDPHHGLSSAEVAVRQQEVGKNVLFRPAKPRSFLQVLWNEIREPMMLLLLSIGVVYAAFEEWEEAATIAVVIAVVILMEVWTEWRAKNALLLLSSAVPRTCLCIRDGRTMDISVADVVPGDVVVLRRGHLVPADCRVIACSGLVVEESVLTGETASAIEKTSSAIGAADGAETANDRLLNIVYAGSSVLRGHCTAVVVETGDRCSAFVTLAKVKKKQPKTRLQALMNKIARYSTITVGVLVALIFTLGLVRGYDWRAVVTLTMAVLFVTVPEELPLMVKSTLAVGALRLAKDQLLMKDLRTVETIAGATVLVTDKTGTLTKNEIFVKELVDLASAEEEGRAVSQAFCWSLALLADLADDWEARRDASDPITRSLCRHVESSWAARSGDSLRKALLQARGMTPVQDFPFDPSVGRRFSFRTFASADFPEQVVLVAVGAPDDVYSTLLEPSPLDFRLKQRFQDTSSRISGAGLRVVAVVSGLVVVGGATDSALPPALSSVYVCALAGFQDPVREEVPASLELLRSYGIRAIMVTGDHPDTALAAAASAGLAAESGLRNRLWDGSRAENHGAGAAGEDGLRQRCADALTRGVVIFARSSPQLKLALVQELQSRGECVLATGDGINDAAALKAADVSIAMAKDGTDAARDCASLLLLDDRFDNIPRGVAESRRLTDSLRKSLMFYLAVKAAILLVVLVPLADFSSQLLTPLQPSQLILLEAFMDAGTALAFLWEPIEDRLLFSPSSWQGGRFLDRRAVGWWLYGVASVAGPVEVSYFMATSRGLSRECLNSAVFSALIFSIICWGLRLRSLRSPLFSPRKLRRWVQNWPMSVWLASGIVLWAFCSFTPGVRDSLGLSYLELPSYGVAVGLPVILFLASELALYVASRCLAPLPTSL